MITADGVSSNVIDFGGPVWSFRQAQVTPMVLLLIVSVTADGTSGNETYAFEVQTDDHSAFSSPTSVAKQDIPRSFLLAGTQHSIGLPIKGIERYLRVSYDVGGTTPSVTIRAWLQPASMVSTVIKNYPNNVQIQ